MDHLSTELHELARSTRVLVHLLTVAMRFKYCKSADDGATLLDSYVQNKEITSVWHCWVSDRQMSIFHSTSAMCTDDASCEFDRVFSV